MCGHQVKVNGQQEQDAGRGGHEGVGEDHTPVCEVIFPGPICRIDRMQYRQLRLKYKEDILNE